MIIVIWAKENHKTKAVKKVSLLFWSLISRIALVIITANVRTSSYIYSAGLALFEQ